ncbi:MAG: ACP phosphodiesterase [Thiolinea sp.]
MPAMNYLAHLSLAQSHSLSLTGNLMGDFMKGVRIGELPVAIQRGISNHRATDRFTDQHPAVLQLKPLFSERYRRFAGIVVDVSFDYFLTKHWQDFHAVPLRGFLDESYQGLLAGRKHMPVRMQETVEKMAVQDWLSGYSSFEQVGFALDRVAERIRFRNDFSGAGIEAEQHYSELEQAFLILYPELQAHISQLAIETK